MIGLGRMIGCGATALAAAVAGGGNATGAAGPGAVTPGAGPGALEASGPRAMERPRLAPTRARNRLVGDLAGLERGKLQGDLGTGVGVRVLDLLEQALVDLGLVVDVDARLGRLGVDLNALLGEESADAAGQTLALAQDDRVGAQLLTDLRDQILELASPISPDAPELVAVAVG